MLICQSLEHQLCMVLHILVYMYIGTQKPSTLLLHHSLVWTGMDSQARSPLSREWSNLAKLLNQFSFAQFIRYVILNWYCDNVNILPKSDVYKITQPYFFMAECVQMQSGGILKNPLAYKNKMKSNVTNQCNYLNIRYKFTHEKTKKN